MKPFKDSGRLCFCHVQPVASEVTLFVTIVAHKKKERSTMPLLLKAQSTGAQITSAAFQ